MTHRRLSKGDSGDALCVGGWPCFMRAGAHGASVARKCGQRVVDKDSARYQVNVNRGDVEHPI